MNPISKLISRSIDNYFNKWTGVHFLANLTIVWTLSQFFNNMTSAFITLAIAILWEIYEFFVEGYKPYGNLTNYAKDTVCDLIVAFICIGAVLL